MADPYQAYDPGARPRRPARQPFFACFRFASAMIAGGLVAPVLAFLYMVILNRGGTTFGDLAIYPKICGVGLIVGPLVTAIVLGLVEIWRRP